MTSWCPLTLEPFDGAIDELPRRAASQPVRRAGGVLLAGTVVGLPFQWACLGLVSLLVAACTPTSFPEPSSSIPATTQATTQAASVSPAPSHPIASAEWTLAASFDGGSLSVNDLTYGSGRYVAIGYDREYGLPGQPIVGRVWLSADGTSWDLLPRDDVFARAHLTDVVTGSDGKYLIFGRIVDASGSFDEVPLAIWESRDGRTWHRTTLGLPADLSAVQVAVGQKGYLLSGTRAGYEMWLSEDARSWDLVQALDEHSVRVAAGTEGFVVTGFRESGYVVTASGDGREWFEATNAPEPAAVHAASLGGDWVLAGGTDDNRGVAIWFSANGLDWNQVATLGESGEFSQVFSVLNAGDAFYVGLARLGDHPALLPAGVWSSTNGTTWRQTELGGEVFLAGAASSGETVVLAGSTTFFVRSVGDPRPSTGQARLELNGLDP